MAYRKKYKPCILKYKALISKYMPCIFPQLYTSEKQKLTKRRKQPFSKQALHIYSLAHSTPQTLPPLHILPAPKKYLQMLFTSKLRINQAFCAKYGRFSKKNFAILINRFNFAV